MICKSFNDFLVKNIEKVNENMEHSFSSHQEKEIKEYIESQGE